MKVKKKTVKVKKVRATRPRVGRQFCIVWTPYTVDVFRDPNDMNYMNYDLDKITSLCTEDYTRVTGLRQRSVGTVQTARITVTDYNNDKTKTKRRV